MMKLREKQGSIVSALFPGNVRQTFPAKQKQGVFCMLKKLQMFALAVLLLVMADLAAIYGFFYLCVFPVPAGDEIAHLGAEYAGAAVLDRCDPAHEYFRYLLVEMPSGEIRVLALQESQNFEGRYRFAPDDTLYVPKQRPFVETMRTATGSSRIFITEDNGIRVFNVAYDYAGAIENCTQLFLIALLAVEFALWLLVIRLRNGRAPTLPVDGSPALQEAELPPPALDRHSLRSGPGHPAQRIHAKRVLKPVPFFALASLAGLLAIYFFYHPVSYPIFQTYRDLPPILYHFEGPLYIGWYAFIWGLSVYFSRRIKPEEEDDDRGKS